MSNSRGRRPKRCSFVLYGERGSHLLTWGLSFNRAGRARPNSGFVETAPQSLLLAGDGLRLALAGAGVGMGALAAHRQLLAMAQAAIGAQIHQPLDIDRDLATKVAFDHIVAVDRLANLQNLSIRQLGDSSLRRDVHLLDNLLGLLAADAVDVLKRDDHALVGGNINACNASHSPALHFGSARSAKSSAAGTGPDVRWRPALVENRERTQKVPCARKWRRDPERLRDGRDVEGNLHLSREKWISASASHSNVIAAISQRSGRDPLPSPRSRHPPGQFAAGFLAQSSARYPSQYHPIPSIAAPSQRKSLATTVRSPQRSSPMTTTFSGRSRTAVAAFALGLGAALSFAGQALADPKVLAKVDGQPITDEDVADALIDIGPGLPQKLEGAARQKYVLDYLVDLKLAAKKAQADNLTASPEFERKLAYYRDKLAMEQLLGSVGKAATTEEAERKAYDAAAKAEPPQQEVHARHILLPTEDEAKKALARVKGGEDFAKVATELSKDPSGNGGDLGWFTKDRMVPEFSDAAFKLKEGEISEPVKTQFGWHIIKIEGVRTKSFPPFEQVKDQAARFVSQKAEQEAILQLHNAAKIELFEADGKPLPPEAPPMDPSKAPPAGADKPKP